MEYPVNVMLEVEDTIWQLGGVDTTPLKTALPWESWIMVYMPEKKHFWFIKLAGKRVVDPNDIKKFRRNKK